MPTNKPRHTITLDEVTYQRIKEYWHAHGFKNMNSAILSLLHCALIDLSDMDILAPQETALLSAYRSAPDICKRMIEAQLQLLEKKSG